MQISLFRSIKKTTSGSPLATLIRNPTFDWGLVRGAFLIAMMFIFEPLARAGGTVTTCAESELAAALAGGGTVTFACNGTITLTSTKTISADTILDSTGHQIIISGGDSVQLFHVNSGVKLTLIGLILEHGKATSGGAIYNAGELVSYLCEFFNNNAVGLNGIPGTNGMDNPSAKGGTGGNASAASDAFGGAIYNIGTVSLDACIFDYNSATGGAGGAGGNGGAGGTQHDGGNGGLSTAGGIARGGAIYNLGLGWVVYCEFDTNSAVGGAGGQGGGGGQGNLKGGYGSPGSSGGNAFGGAVYSDSTFSITNSTLDGNEAVGAGGGDGGNGGRGINDFHGFEGAGGLGGQGAGGALYSGGNLQSFGSTFRSNLGAGGNGGNAGLTFNNNWARIGTNGGNGGLGLGGGVCNDGTSSTINCTFYTNVVSGGQGGGGGYGWPHGGNGGDGGMARGGGIHSTGLEGLTNSTVSTCMAYGGNGGAAVGPSPANNGAYGGIWGGNIARWAGTFFLRNSIIAYGGINGNPSIVDAGFNISSDGSISMTNTGSIFSTDPKLGPLAANGGPTMTCALLANSPCINAGSDTTAPSRDQRGFSRANRSDIGAFETGAVDDFPAVGVYVTNTVVSSGSPTALVFCRTNGVGSLPATTVQYELGGSAIPDYYSAAPALTGSVTIPASQANSTNIVSPAGLLKGSKVLRVTLTGEGSQYKIISAQRRTAMEILVDYPVITIGTLDKYASEVNTNTAVFTISRSGDTNRTVNVGLSITGTAVPGLDYFPLPTIVVLGPGVTSSNLTVVPIGDLVTERAETVVVGLAPAPSYFLGLSTNAVITIGGEGPEARDFYPRGTRYMRGSGGNLNTYSVVIPLDGTKGSRRSEIDSTDFGATGYHYSGTNVGNQAYATNRIIFNTPIASFGAAYGTPLYLQQSYSFGILQGLTTSDPFLIQVFRRTDGTLAGSMTIPSPVGADWLSFATNGFARATNGFGLTTVLRGAPDMTWGADVLGWQLTHSATEAATNYVFYVCAMGQFDGKYLVINGAGSPAYDYFYELKFDARPAWRSVFIEQPHFQGAPLPPDLWNKSADELLNYGAVVTNSVSLLPSSCTNIDQSPELRRHPMLDQFVADLNNDPLALANYVQNEIELTDAIAYRDDGTVDEESVNEGGINRGALGVYLEGQGSPIEQCALLIYLLRQAGFPAAYVFPPQSGLKMLDERLSSLLRFRLNGAQDSQGRYYTTNRLIPVNYPWVAAYFNSQWVHLFPWIKDTSVEEGLDIYDYLPDPYKDSQLWVRDYILGKTNLMMFAKTNDDTAGTVFQGFLNNALLQNAPGISTDDIGMRYVNRRHLYNEWNDFPRPTSVTNVSFAAESLGSDQVTNVAYALTNIFNTVQLELYSVNNPSKIIQTPPLRMADLHNRKLYVIQTNAQNGEIQASLTLGPFRASALGQGSFSSGDVMLTNKQVLSLALDQSDDGLQLRVRHRRQRALAWETAVDPERKFLDLGATREFLDERSLRKGDLAAICFNAGRVTPAMLRVHAQELWNMEQLLSTNAAAATNVSTDVYEGSLSYLLGMSYYERNERFDSFVPGLFKVQNLSTFAIGLAKLSPRRDINGTLYAGPVDPVWPNLDMFYRSTAAVGNGGVRTDSGRDWLQTLGNCSALQIANGSSQEHATLNTFFGQSNSVSTVKVLQLAQSKVASGGSNVVELNYSNYVAAGNVIYNGKALKDHDPDIWSTVVSSLTSTSALGYAVAWVPPGTQTTASGSFSGMAALILAGYDYGAIIGNNQYGAYGDNLGDKTVAPQNLSNFKLRIDGGNNYNLMTTDVDAGAGLIGSELFQLIGVPQEIDLYNNGGYIPNQFQAFQAAAIGQSLFSGSSEYAAFLPLSIDVGPFATRPDFREGNGILQNLADPVNSLTGEFYIDDVDLTLPGPMPLQIRRNYGSQNLANNQLGFGWKLNYMPWLTVAPSNNVVYAAESDGSVLAFGPLATNLWAPSLALNPTLNNNSTAGIGSVANSFNARLAKVTGATNFWYLTNGDGSLRVFQEMSFPLAANLDRLRPYLTFWYDCRNNYYRFEYGTNSSQADYGQVRRIVSSSGNLVRFEYDVYGRIVNAYSLDGRRVQYDYDEHGDLIRVTRPDTSEVRYEYEQTTAVIANTVDASTNLAQGVFTVSQSSTYNGVFPAGPAYKATDGNTSADFTAYSFTVTEYDSNAWWEISLTMPHRAVRTVKIWPMFPCCQDFASNYYVLASSNAFTSHSLSGTLAQSGVSSYYHPGMAEEPSTVPVNRTANWIRIQLAGSNRLSLAEVQVFEATTDLVTNSFSSHLLVREEKPDGRVLKNEYDSQRRVTNQWATVGPDLRLVRNATFLYTNNFSLTNVTNILTGTTTILDYANNPMTYYYTNGLIRRIRDPLSGELVQTWYEANETNAPAYPRSLKTVTDKRGLVTSYFYDSKGNVTNTTVQGDLRGDGDTSATATTLATYNTNNLPVKTIDPSGSTNLYFYTNTWLLARLEIWPSNAMPSQAITNLYSYGNVTNAADGTVCYGVRTQEVRAAFSPDAATNQWIYSSRGYPVQTTRYPGTADPAVAVTNIYNTRGELAIQTDAAGRSTVLGFDPRGQPQSREVYDTAQSIPMSWDYFYYNENGELTWSDGPRFNPEDYVWRDYDGSGRKSQEIHWRSQAKSDGSGVEAPGSDNLYATTFFQYDPFGNLVRTTDPRGNYSVGRYDVIGRLVRTEFYDAGGSLLATNGLAYNAAGDVTNRFNPLGGAEQTQYTSTAKPKFERHADGSTNGWTYYADGRVRREIQRNGAYWEATYDNANRKTTRIFYSASSSPLATNSTVLDRRGNVVQTVDAGFNVFTNLFDGLDRLKVAAGPPIVTVSASIDFGSFITSVVQQVTTYLYDNSGKTLTVSNALGEKTVTTYDPLARPLTTQIYAAGGGSPIRVTGNAYSADHHSISTTNGTGTNAIISKAYSDNDGHPLLSIEYPSANATEFSRREYDLAGNLVHEERDSGTNGSVTVWTTADYLYDGLNRLSSKADRDNALTYFYRDAAGNVTNQVMPGGSLKWQATYNNAGQMLQEWNLGAGGAGTRTNRYGYFPPGSALAGLLQSKTNGLGTAWTCSYDDWLRLTTNTMVTWPQLNTARLYDARGLVTNTLEWYEGSNVKELQRAYDAYANLISQSDIVPDAFTASASQEWDSAGRRAFVALNEQYFIFGWRGDGLLTSASAGNGSANYTYTDGGLLTSRAVGSRLTSVASRDGTGRPLSLNTKLNLTTKLAETLTYTGDGLLSTHTLAREDFTDSRSYSYAALTRRLAEERLNLDATRRWTNTFTVDGGAAGGLGVLTHLGGISGSSGSNSWSGAPDALGRIAAETNNVIRQVATGRLNGTATVVAQLDGQPMPVMLAFLENDPNWPYRWQSTLELNPGAHQVTVSAAHPSGFFTTNASIWLTNNSAGQTVSSAFDLIGQLTQRVWTRGGTNVRVQTLTWDALGRLWWVRDTDSQTNGFYWQAEYDPEGRLFWTTAGPIIGGDSGNLVDQWKLYDPQTKLLELGVSVDGATTWKLYGPDLNGVYGGLSGIGGLEGTVDDLGVFETAVGDARGNILAYRDPAKSSLTWNASRPAAYGAVPGYRPLPMNNRVGLLEAAAWHGKTPEASGYYALGARQYEPVSGQWLSSDPVFDPANPGGRSFCGADPVNYFDPDGRFGKGIYSSVAGAVSGTAQLLWNGGGSLGYGITSMFSEEAANEIYGGQLQGLKNAAEGFAELESQFVLEGNFGMVGKALTGGEGKSGAFRSGFALGTLGTILAGNELGAVGSAGGRSAPVALLPERAASSVSRGAYFFGDDVLPYINKADATLGRSGQSQFFAPLEDVSSVSSTADAARLSGQAPSITRAYTTGGNGYGVVFPTDGLPMRLPTAADALGNANFLAGGRTAVGLGTDVPNGFLRNATREFVTPGGGAMPQGSVLFEFGPNGSWIPIRKF